MVQYSSNFGGSTISGEMIAHAMLEEGWELDIVFGFEGPFVQRMSGPKCRTHVSAHGNWLRHPGLFRFLRNLRREQTAVRQMVGLFRNIKPDLVYVNSLVSYAGARAANQLGVPVVWHIRELFSDRKGELHWPVAWAKPYIRRVIRSYAANIVMNSNSVRHNVFGRNTVRNIEVIRNAVPRSFFQPHSQELTVPGYPGLNIRGPIVGFPGTLRPVKGHRVFLAAIGSILEAVPNSHFVITGAVKSEFAVALVNEVEAGPHRERVHFVGEVRDMRDFYRAADVCCIASESESFGRTAIETFACRTPLVSTNSGGLADIVDHEVNCLVTEFGNANQLARAVVRLLTDPQLSRRLTSAGYDKAVKYFGDQACSSAIIRVVRNSLQEKSGTVSRNKSNSVLRS